MKRIELRRQPPIPQLNSWPTTPQLWLLHALYYVTSSMVSALCNLCPRRLVTHAARSVADHGCMAKMPVQLQVSAHTPESAYGLRHQQ